MTDQQSTVTEIGETGLHSLEGMEGWSVTLFHHPNDRFAGRRVMVESGKHLLLGRDETPFGESGLYEKRVSNTVNLQVSWPLQHQLGTVRR